MDNLASVKLLMDIRDNDLSSSSKIDDVIISTDLTTDAVDANTLALGTKLDSVVTTLQASNLNSVARSETFTLYGTITRPANTTAYAIGDAITNSTTAPTTVAITVGAANDFVMITGLKVVSSATNGFSMNAYISGYSFTATNDNSALSITAADLKYMHVELLSSIYSNTSSSVMVSAPMNRVLQTSDGILYIALQAAVAYTPVSSGQFTIELQGIVLTK